MELENPFRMAARSTLMIQDEKSHYFTRSQGVSGGSNFGIFVCLLIHPDFFSRFLRIHNLHPFPHLAGSRN